LSFGIKKINILGYSALEMVCDNKVTNVVMKIIEYYDSVNLELTRRELSALLESYNYDKYTGLLTLKEYDAYNKKYTTIHSYKVHNIKIQQHVPCSD